MRSQKQGQKTDEFILDEEEYDSPSFDWNLLRRLLRYLKPYRLQIIFLYVLAVSAIGCTLLIPYLIKVGIDNYIKNKDFPGLLHTAALFLAVVILQYFVQREQGRLVISMGQKAITNLRLDLFKNLQELSFRFYDQQKAGRIMVRVTNDVNALEELLATGINTIFADSLTLIGIIAVMFWLDIRLSSVLFITVPLLVWLVFVIKGKMLEVIRKTRKKISAVNAYLNESILGIKVTQAFAREEANIRMFGQINQEHFQAIKKFVPLNAFFWGSVGFLNYLGTVLVLCGGGLLLRANLITLGTIAAFMNYISRFFNPLQNLSNLFNQISTAMASSERIFALMDMKPEVKDKKDAKPCRDLRGEVEFDHVFFGYKNETILKDFNLRIKAGNSIALVGPTGAGKSTVINLLCRFYDPNQGSIRVDGVDLKDFRQKDYRSRIAVVLQDTFIFSGSVLDNIRFGNESATFEDVEKITKEIGIHQFIMQLPEGYDTQLRERGSRLSIGQKQLLAFARALIRRPSILILDEATSNLDTQTERIIQNAMEIMMKDRTTLIIAHRLSTVRKVNKIVVIDGGKIVEEGRHEELLSSRGIYRNLYESHFRYNK